MTTRALIHIDEELCDGCGLCVPSCAEGAIQIIEGKARLVGEALCDGLGACLGHCPQGALRVEQVEAAPFDPEAVEAHLADQARRAGPEAAEASAAPARLPSFEAPATSPSAGGGCPGARSRQLAAPASPAPSARGEEGEAPASTLSHWPIQLGLVAPRAPFLEGADLLLTAHCAPPSSPDFQSRWLAGRVMAMACPKLDADLDAHVARLAAIMDEGGVSSLTVLVMEVPCCSGLWQMALAAREKARRKVPMRVVRLGLDGRVLDEQRVAS